MQHSQRPKGMVSKSITVYIPISQVYCFIEEYPNQYKGIDGQYLKKLKEANAIIDLKIITLESEFQELNQQG